jgi:outer membrane protein TolC
VEDNLAALRILEEEAAMQDEAVNASRQSVAISTNQYKAGIVSYLDVVTVMTIQFNNEQTAIGINGRRMSASVLLIKALGGGWDASALRMGNSNYGEDTRTKTTDQVKSAPSIAPNVRSE